MWLCVCQEMNLPTQQSTLHLPCIVRSSSDGVCAATGKLLVGQRFVMWNDHHRVSGLPIGKQARCRRRGQGICGKARVMLAAARCSRRERRYGTMTDTVWQSANGKWSKRSDRPESSFTTQRGQPPTRHRWLSAETGPRSVVMCRVLTYRGQWCTCSATHHAPVQPPTTTNEPRVRPGIGYTATITINHFWGKIT